MRFHPEITIPTQPLVESARTLIRTGLGIIQEAQALLRQVSPEADDASVGLFVETIINEAHAEQEAMTGMNQQPVPPDPAFAMETSHE
jgi:hypothetical protein